MSGCSNRCCDDRICCDPCVVNTCKTDCNPCEDSYERSRYQPTRPTWSCNTAPAYDSCNAIDIIQPISPCPTPCGSEYTVQKGDTLWGIARRHGTTAQAIADANGISKNCPLKIGQCLSIPACGSAHASTCASSGIKAGGEYIVQHGDSLSKIAHHNGTTVKAIKELNGLRNDTIRVGQKLQLPCGGYAPVNSSTSCASTPVHSYHGDTYTVKAGDSISKIASRTGVKSSEIVRLNNLSDPNRLRVGQVLALTSSGVSSASHESSFDSHSSSHVHHTTSSVSAPAHDTLDLFKEETLTTTETYTNPETHHSVTTTHETSFDDTIFDTDDEVSVIPVEEER